MVARTAPLGQHVLPTDTVEWDGGDVRTGGEYQRERARPVDGGAAEEEPKRAIQMHVYVAAAYAVVIVVDYCC